ncbi:cell division protein FtsQ [Komagataeibacter nataicola]|uniref:Cell division protein FtsQ n=1 Tax=Komagataeibacter nataicola TaxID=265960 RepID=A0A9N7C5F3_9PROT|nr:cell division protein FtsQ/DivIB [Komagataeibacter nataicola]AQU86713.1 cell division protein FtsQ [Komagataeibacter nataicola]PYD65769.1 cell division protein FtsQ [Komagataeibacter nataicola]WEQ56342.1 cell division protein FtsQ/DivIB [Komagataeibacter nataicola]WNM07911.1 cell division protein FtsQ/DivIB [Komagataeibacter nataicola]GBR19315.1 cell division protein FtsQ [Komagataeibacter nataicola NRIC 0616]
MRRPTDSGDRPSRLSIFLRRQKRLLRPALLVLVLVGLVAGGITMLRHVGSDPRFAALRGRIINMLPLRITEIDVTGCVLTSESALQEALGVRTGDFILGFSVKAARERIDALPFVDHSVVERHLPGTILIHLFERQPFAVWQNHGHFMLIDRAGNQVRDKGMTGKDAEAFRQLPLVVGPDANLAAAAMIDELTAQPEVSSHVVAAARVGQRRWNLTLRNGTTILLPEGQEVAALKRLAQMQETIKILDRPVIAIDMRLPDRLIIRENPVTPNDNNNGPDQGDSPPPAAPTSDQTPRQQPWLSPDNGLRRRRA